MNIPTYQSLLRNNRAAITGLHINIKFYKDTAKMYRQLFSSHTSDYMESCAAKLSKKLATLVRNQKELKKELAMLYENERLENDYNTFFFDGDY